MWSVAERKLGDNGSRPAISLSSDEGATVVCNVRGTGTNACYLEQLGRITKWLPQYRPRTPDMVVNIEWPGRLQCLLLTPDLSPFASTTLSFL